VRPRLSRRGLLKQLGGLGACLPLIGSGAFEAGNAPSRPHYLPQNKPPLSEDDERFLDEIERASFLFFWEQANPQTGLVRDRCNVRGGKSPNVASIASVGFGLTAICIAEKRGYISTAEARERVLNTLRYLWKTLPNHRGFFFHFVDMNNGNRVWNCELSSIDTSLLLCGVLTCRQHFAHSEISELAQMIYDRVDWEWMAEDTLIVSGGWQPDTGFLQFRWDSYCELMMIYLLGIGASQHALGPESWDAWKRTQFDDYGIKYVGSTAPVFIHQYSQAWFDFRDKHDRHADYFQNSIVATDIHRRFCLSLAKEFPDYSEDLWGITSSDSVKGYVAWGGPPATGPIDGSVVPCAAGGSVAFLPGPALRVLRTIRSKYAAEGWCRYGFIDAFNPLTHWYNSDVIGIDVGITVLMAENARSGFVWETFMKNPEAQRGMKLAGFQNYEGPLSQRYLPSPAPNQLGAHV